MSKTATPTPLDVKVENQTSFWLFTPMTAAARAWVDKYANLEPWQWMGASFAVEARFVKTLVEAMRADELVVGK